MEVRIQFFFSERSLLDLNGNSINCFVSNNSIVNNLHEKIKVSFFLTHSKVSKLMAVRLIFECNPSLVHIHNFFPLLTPSIYDACIEAGVPVVQTLHNYRTICPGALLMLDGKICEQCITGSPYRAMVHRCYRNSVPGSWAVARMVAYHRKRRTWQTKVDRFIALTRFGKEKFVQAGFPAEKIAIKPNFYDASHFCYAPNHPSTGQALFVGRLSREKGVATLLQAWHGVRVPLRIVGDGPLMPDICKVGNPAIETLGQLSGQQVSAEMGRASFLVMPSEWYEGFPMVLVEAFAHGLPVVASRLGSMAEIVEDGITGLHFEPGNPHDLARKVQWLHDHPEECRQMGENARRDYEAKYTPERNYEMLMRIYEEVIEEKKRVRS